MFGPARRPWTSEQLSPSSMLSFREETMIQAHSGHSHPNKFFHMLSPPHPRFPPNVSLVKGLYCILSPGMYLLFGFL